MKRALGLGVMGLLLTACIPDVYLIDRQTVLELEASGDWPELDRKFQSTAFEPGPTPLEQTRDRVETRQIFSMTQADREEAETKSPAPKQP